MVWFQVLCRSLRCLADQFEVPCRSFAVFSKPFAVLQSFAVFSGPLKCVNRTSAENGNKKH